MNGFRCGVKPWSLTLKAWQLITHPASSPTYRRLKLKLGEKERLRYGFFNPTDEVFKAWDVVDKIATALRAKLILFQSPASFKPEKANIDNLKKFFKKLNPALLEKDFLTGPIRNIDFEDVNEISNGVNRKDYKFIWEPRGNWPESIIEGLCKDLSLIHCVDPFKNKSLYGEIRYFRLHGLTGYRYKYSLSDLKRLLGFCPLKLPTYAMFNNTNMWEDAAKFKRLSGSLSGS